MIEVICEVKLTTEERLTKKDNYYNGKKYL